MPGQCSSGVVEGHADVHGRIAITLHMLHFMAAVAHADPAMCGGPDDFAGAFVVQHVQGIFFRQDGFEEQRTGFALGGDDYFPFFRKRFPFRQRHENMPRYVLLQLHVTAVFLHNSGQSDPYSVPENGSRAADQWVGQLRL